MKTFLKLETLPDRVNPSITFVSGGILVTGTDGPDTVGTYDSGGGSTTIYRYGTTPAGAFEYETLTVPTSTMRASRLDVNLLGGDDVYQGGSAAAITENVSGGDGNDSLQGGHGGGTLDGGAGNDEVSSGHHFGFQKTLTGGAGSDRVYCGQGSDLVQFDAADSVYGFNPAEDAFF